MALGAGAPRKCACPARPHPSAAAPRQPWAQIRPEARHGLVAILLVFALLLAQSPACASTRPAAEPPAAGPDAAELAWSWEDSAEEEYVYEGRVDFRKARESGAGHGGGQAQALAPGPPLPPLALAGEMRTILITREGHRFSKLLPAEVVAAQEVRFEDLIFEPWPGPQPRMAAGGQGPMAARRLAQFDPQVSIGQTTTDLTCDGCNATDTRVLVTDTSRFPYSAVGQLLAATSSDRGVECTGTLISPLHVLTAAHCVFDVADSHQYVSALNFSPALAGGADPFATVPWASVRVLSQFTSQTSYSPTAMNFDFALITLRVPADAAAGYLGMLPGSGEVSLDLRTAGYPGDKGAGTMWTDTCSGVDVNYNGNQGVFANIEECQDNGCANILAHSCISTNGQSGSSMWDSGVHIRAILTGKVTTSDNQNMNTGTKIDAFVYNTVAMWYNEDAGGGPNATLPLAPSGQQSPGPSPPVGRQVFGVPVNWADPAFLAIIVGIILGGSLVVGALFLWCCGGTCRSWQRHSMPKPRGPNDARVPVTADAGLGVVYDPRTQQFLVNGRPYGTYPYVAAQHTR